MSADDQRYGSALIYILQIVDVFTDFVFALQCRAYWKWALEDGGNLIRVEPSTFEMMYTLALSFVVAPYGL